MWDSSLSIVDCTRSETLLFVRLCTAANEPEPPTLLVKACSTAWSVGLTPSAVHKQSNQSFLHLQDRSYLLQNSFLGTIAPPAQGIPQQAMTHVGPNLRTLFLPEAASASMSAVLVPLSGSGPLLYAS